jgi:lipopolysaccharide/colanic/teichoic acid biosynthesis glycosyltransferase
LLGSRQQAVTFEPVKLREDAKDANWQRLLDVTVAMVALFILLPFLLLVALAILIEDGRPILFRQERVGRHKQAFPLYKFRSMHKDADVEFHRQHVSKAVNGVTSLRPVNDPRITRVGRLIRRWSIDELPNFWNVIRGDLSLVGPRPLVPYEADAIGPDHHRRFSVRPGVTGLAQVSGRLDMSHEERLDLDVTYAYHRNLWMDVAILAKTIPCMIRMRG